MIIGSIARSGTDGVKLCMEEGPLVPSFVSNFTPSVQG